jgi:uncharacterized protein (DUF736 family)
MQDFKNEIPSIQKCAIWRKQSKKGNEYLAGVVTIDGKEYKLVAFANKYKDEGQNRPDWKFDIAKQ